MMRRREVGEAGAMERRHQEVAGAAGAVAGENTAGAIRAVGRRRKADDQHSRVGISEAWNRTRPVRLVAIRAPFFTTDLLAVLPQPWTAFAGNDRSVNVF